ncbi:hypothetical protein D082_25990 [Synechocystis sp. PCC 6714]|nr:hypothetical protein D082_25990 [Synechocystis sp. PCC 6714]
MGRLKGKLLINNPHKNPKPLSAYPKDWEKPLPVAKRQPF